MNSMMNDEDRAFYIKKLYDLGDELENGNHHDEAAIFRRLANQVAEHNITFRKLLDFIIKEFDRL